MGKAGMIFLLRNTRLTVTLLAIIIIGAPVPGLETVGPSRFSLHISHKTDLLNQTLPLFVEKTFHWSPSGAGLIFLAITIPTFSGGLIGKFVDRFGTRYPSCIGFAVASITVICLRFVEHNNMVEKVILVWLLVVISLTITLVKVGGMVGVFLIVEETEKHEAGVFGGKSPIAKAYALLNIAAAFSHLGAPLMAGFVQERAGWKTMTLALGLLCGVTAIIQGLFGDDSSSYAKKTEVQGDV